MVGVDPDKVLYVVSLRPEPGYEDKFNQWYVEEHLPELLDCPGFEAAARYEAIEGTPKYLALYQMTSMAAFSSPEYEKLRARTLDDLSPLAREVREHRAQDILAKYRQTVHMVKGEHRSAR